LIVPTIDDELELFGAAAAGFASRGAKVAVSPETTSHVCNDKLLTCQQLRAHGIRAAQTYLPKDLPARRQFPLFIKPRTGRGGVGAHAIHSAKDLAFFVDYVENPIVQEYLDGPEFTIDVLCDFRTANFRSCRASGLSFAPV
jgi:carbamoyl-phosphate synthase large subunit